MPFQRGFRITAMVIILWIAVLPVAPWYRQAAESSDGASKFCLREDASELKMLSSGITASGFRGREYCMSCVMKYINNLRYPQLP